MIQTQKVTVPTSYFKNVGRIYPNAFIEGINQYYTLGEGWTLEAMDCTRNNLEALKQKGASSVNLKITRQNKVQLFVEVLPLLQNTPIRADFKIEELI